MRILLFANGLMADPVTEIALHAQPGDLIVAADGGARHALAAGLPLHHVIGDLDSFPADRRAALEATGTRFHVYPPAKDETDLELALLWTAMQASPVSVLIFGALGGRPDQELANLLLLALPQLAGISVCLVSGEWRVRCIRAGETLHLCGHPGETLSLLPLGGAAHGITTAGLAYPLHRATLAFGPARGVSNAFTQTQASVAVEDGLLWCFHSTSV